MHLYKFFYACRYLALTASVEVRTGSPKTARNEFVRTKSPTVSKFSNFFEQLYTGWTVVVHPYCGFSLRRQMAPQHSMQFLPSVRELDVLYSALNVS